MRRTAPSLNFFTLGRRRGPANYLFLRGTARYTNDCPMPGSPVGFHRQVARDLVGHQCKDCKYVWWNDRMSIRCSSNPEHCVIENGLDHNWRYEKQQPRHFYPQLGSSYWPKFDMRLEDDVHGSLHNRERRSAGVGTRTRTMKKWSNGIAAEAQGGVIRHHSTWKIKFPYPT